MNAVAGMTAAIVALALLWLAVAIAIAIVAARRFRLADTGLGPARSDASLPAAAPFPVGFGGTDARPGRVNPAFGEAVEGRDAVDVIARSAELIDGEGANSGVETAREAVDSGHIQSSMQPAIIGGERRMLRLVNVPLPTRAVAGFSIHAQGRQEAPAELTPHHGSHHKLPARTAPRTSAFAA